MGKQKNKLKLNNYIVFDCETGGLDRKNQKHAINHPITDIALVALKASDLSEIGRLHLYIKGRYDEDGEYVGYGEGMTYQQQALDFTKITFSKLEDEGVSHTEAANQIYDFIKDCNLGSYMHKPIFVGHNVTYDIPFLQMLMYLNKKDLSKVSQGYVDYLGNFHPNYLDTMWLSRMHRFEEGQKHNLTACCGEMEVDLFDAHTALEDTQATAELFRKYVSNIRSKGNSESQGVGKFRDKFKFQL